MHTNARRNKLGSEEKNNNNTHIECGTVWFRNVDNVGRRNGMIEGV